MHGYQSRKLEAELARDLRNFPSVAVLGPRQCGKTTLVRQIVTGRPEAVYLDLERPSDLRKLSNPELYFQSRRARQDGVLFCLDEIQRVPELFPLLRSLIDEDGRNGQFLLLGSTSRELIRQTSESLADRISFLELTPFLASEIDVSNLGSQMKLWSRGGFPRSYLAADDEASQNWRNSFVQTFLERDIPALGFDIPAETLRRLWRMLAHSHGQMFNSSKLGGALGVSHTTLRSYVDLLVRTFMVRLLEPLEANVKKRLVKSPKVYLRDSGILHSLLQIDNDDDLLGHPVFGASWEGLVIESVIASMPGWQPAFYRTSNGAELDLVLTRGRRRIAVECKAAADPKVGRGFWTSIDDLRVEHAWVVAPVNESYPLRENVTVTPLDHLLNVGLESGR
jgi:predicted AAA+ superfamily ATPase